MTGKLKFDYNWRDPRKAKRMRNQGTQQMDILGNCVLEFQAKTSDGYGRVHVSIWWSCGMCAKENKNRTADLKADHTKPCPFRSSLHSPHTRKSKEVLGKNWSLQMKLVFWLQWVAGGVGGRQKDLLCQETGGRGDSELRVAAENCAAITLISSSICILPSSKNWVFIQIKLSLLRISYTVRWFLMKTLKYLAH